jgi:endonuclease YncB( thermonuclease family)
LEICAVEKRMRRTAAAHAFALSLLATLLKFETVGMIPQKHFEQNTVLFGFTERVIDGDTIRVRHVPLHSIRRWLLLFGPRQKPLDKRGIAGETLSLRIYGVDCPELTKTKSQVSQPFAEQAKQFTADLCLHRMVRITLIRKDQYGRAVCVIETMPAVWCSWIPGCGHKDLSLELARDGLAELYTGGGAEYFSRREQLEAAMERAAQQKLGIWSLSSNHRISAAEHKRLTKQEAAVDSGQPQKQKPQSKTTRQPLQGRSSSESRPSRENQKATVPSASKASKKYRSALLESAVTGLEFVG